MKVGAALHRDLVEALDAFAKDANRPRSFFIEKTLAEKYGSKALQEEIAKAAA